jgi:hypothetical protein
MKTYIKIISISILSTFTLGASAQSQARNIFTPSISKDVVRFSNKDASMRPQLAIRSIGYPPQVISKAVQKQTRRQKSPEVQTNMVSSGYPDWIISKAVNVRKK